MTPSPAAHHVDGSATVPSDSVAFGTSGVGESVSRARCASNPARPRGDLQVLLRQRREPERVIPTGEPALPPQRGRAGGAHVRWEPTRAQSQPGATGSLLLHHVELDSVHESVVADGSSVGGSSSKCVSIRLTGCGDILIRDPGEREYLQ